MRRFAVSLVLALAACGGGGGGSSAILPPPDPPPMENPAPAPPRGEPIDLAGVWRLVESNMIEGFGESSPLGTLLDIAPAGEGFEVRHVLVPMSGTNVLIPVSRQAIELSVGFAVDWYENEGDGTFFDYGYGWDRLTVPGGGLAMHDFVQYGLRLAPTSPTVLVGYEAEWTESVPGNERFKWLAEVRLMRTP